MTDSGNGINARIGTGICSGTDTCSGTGTCSRTSTLPMPFLVPVPLLYPALAIRHEFNSLSAIEGHARPSTGEPAGIPLN